MAKNIFDEGNYSVNLSDDSDHSDDPEDNLKNLISIANDVDPRVNKKLKPNPDSPEPEAKRLKYDAGTDSMSYYTKKESLDRKEEIAKQIISGNHTEEVAKHYNALEEKSEESRCQSRIFHMRNFNNWIKGMLIDEYLRKIREKRAYGSKIVVSDICCGQGGDLYKWLKGKIFHLICSDIASVSVERCKNRYKNILEQNSNRQRGNSIFTAEFISIDLTKNWLRQKYQDPTVEIDLVSCQFSFHYSFESLPQVECMLRNASECLRPGGYFIGTIPDANELIKRQRAANSESFGNEIYNIKFQCNTDNPPLFGAKYYFQLEEVVNCPEFLVYFPLFVKLAAKYGLKLVRKERFDEFYNRMNRSGHHLLQKMKSLETYPPDNGTLVGTASDDYLHAERHLQKRPNSRFGTLSKSEWEAITLYLTFAFEKQKPS